MHQITVNDLTVDVVRKDIKNLHLAVYPPAGRVRVAVPLRVNDEAVRLAVISKLGWIRRQQRSFQEQERQSAREYVSGESHYFQGLRYLLNVIYHDGWPRVELRGKKRIDLYVRKGSDTATRERIFLQWYRRQLKAQAAPMIAKWEPIIGVTVADWGIKQMKTRWGSCNAQAARIWLNLELIKKSPQCLEYLVVHEMVHLLERLHSDAFKAHMDAFLPQWRLNREELNREPLAHETWTY
ncbi:MAG: M48 family metallopeptidase [Armatimonadetes bacterium]|nr:M48 family metallopeptidase [Armatimonadota bacterium]